MDLKTQLNSCLCVQERNKNPCYSIPNFFVAYDAKVFSLRLSFFASQAVVGYKFIHGVAPGRVAQSVTCLATDACLTVDPGVASSIPARSHTFVEIDHEIISTVILLPSADSFKKGCCQLQAKVCAQITG